MVQTHRCPATVSGTKSAETTEVFDLGKVQRVGTCREPGDLPYMALRRPFEGKGRQRVCADPDRSRLGFFSACCFPVPCGTALLPSLWGKRRRGESEPWFLPQRCLPLSSIPSSKQRATHGAASRLCSAQAASVAYGHDHGHTLDHGSTSASRYGSPQELCVTRADALACSTRGRAVPRRR